LIPSRANIKLFHSSFLISQTFENLVDDYQKIFDQNSASSVKGNVTLVVFIVALNTGYLRSPLFAFWFQLEFLGARCIEPPE